jgi:hypothetical protein
VFVIFQSPVFFLNINRAVDFPILLTMPNLIYELNSLYCCFFIKPAGAIVVVNSNILKKKKTIALRGTTLTEREQLSVHYLKVKKYQGASSKDN